MAQDLITEYINAARSIGRFQENAKHAQAAVRDAEKARDKDIMGTDAYEAVEAWIRAVSAALDAESALQQATERRNDAERALFDGRRWAE